MVFKKYDVRGVYPTEINSELAYKIGRTFIELNDEVVLGYDIRIGSEELKESFKKGALESGVKVVEVGRVPNPTTFYHAIKNKTHGAYITASHNPPQYNGIKIINPQGVTDLEGLKTIKKELNKKRSTKKTEPTKIREPVEQYLKYLEKKIRGVQGLKVGVDCMYGAASLIIKQLTQRFNIEGVYVRSKPINNFRGLTPEPKPSKAKKLIKKIKEHGLDYGVMIDSDCDRAMIIDDEGKIVPADVIGYLYAELDKKRIVTTINSSLIIKKFKPKIVPVGRPNLEKEIMRGAEFAYEPSNHYYFKELYPFSDGFATLLKIGELINKHGPLSELTKNVPKPRTRRHDQEFRTVKERDEKYNKIIEKIKKTKGEKIMIDGVRINYDNAWILIRKSNTEPKIRIISEGSNEEIKQIIKTINANSNSNQE